MRCQKSVFIYRGSPQTLTKLLDQLSLLIDSEFDVIQAWRLPRRQSAGGLRRGRAAVLFPDVALLGDNELRFVGGSDDGNEEPNQ